MKTFKQWLAVSFVSFFAVILPAQAQIPVTDIASNYQQGVSYAKQVLQYVTQLQQYDNEIKNLMQNPASLMGADISGLINGIGSIMSAANSIGGSMALIDNNFSYTFKNPTAAKLAEKFTQWHNVSSGTLEGALKAAGMHRDSRQSDTDALNALYDESQASDGNLKAIQTLSKINSMQVQQLQKLQDLLATQNIAASTYMAAQTAKDQTTVDLNKNMAMPSRDPRAGYTGTANKY